MPKIVGGTVVTPMPIADLAQTNPKRADYVKGKDLIANSIKRLASGNPIRLDDVSPLEHEMAVTVDVNGAEVQKLGKNIWKFEDLKYDAGSPLTKTDTGFISTGGVGTSMFTRQRWLPISALDGIEGTISFDAIPSGKNKPKLLLRYISEDGKTSVNVVETGTVGANTAIPFKIDSTKAPTCKYLIFNFYSNSSSSTDGLTSTDIVEWSNFQIEIGNKTAYEPYHSETYTADANGNVNGIIGNGEDITLMGDGVTITAEYNADTKKYIDKKFAELSAAIVNNG